MLASSTLDALIKPSRMAFTLLLLHAAVLPLAPLANAAAQEPYSPNVGTAPDRQVYFGDTHVHTGLSADAGGSGTRLMPEDAYRFARGEEVLSNTGQPVKLRRPYDFFMITDHSDGMGLISDLLEGTSNVMADPKGKRYHEDFNAGGQQAADAMFRLIAEFSQGKTPEALLYQPGVPAYRRVWERLVAAAEEFDDPGRFTTFIAYEWTSLVKGNNLHRNVIFRDDADKALEVVPFTTTPPIGSRNPRDLWSWMAAYEKDTGGDVTAIPHNGNLSNGMMFPLRDDFDSGKELDAAYAKSRMTWERIYEVTQFKGDGEAHPLLSPDDEFADFETWDFGNLDASQAKTPAMLPSEYARSGLLRGLQLQQTLGINPYQFGFQGATDTHTGLSTADEDNFFSKFTTTEPSATRTVHPGKSNPDLGIEGFTGWMYNAAGVTAVWAEQNSRTAIFDAMERRETYATTGPRIALRFFGGWSFEAGDASIPDLARKGYELGVPMGSELGAAGAKAPSFIISALRDPIGANLDRIQVVKGWVTAEGEAKEQVYNVAWSDGRELDADGKLPGVGNTVDLSVPTWSNSIGAAELSTVWRDPDFDAAQAAFYYVRVLEIPTPRWTAYDAVRFGVEAPEGVTLITQERAYSSPIWYTP
ncbi:DUF3604 domain-containing protein [Congregibacter variabilis]|uniref:DUF3604 domain-containing protein n=1 Tax=Congregibacter variabilis TaxID=3081200 RepID=A0ABZ0I103_9GAMM|nr:DUF3604 domain-containing protein [Congregibacter sp. IMCC43200]